MITHTIWIGFGIKQMMLRLGEAEDKFAGQDASSRRAHDVECSSTRMRALHHNHPEMMSKNCHGTQSDPLMTSKDQFG